MSTPASLAASDLEVAAPRRDGRNVRAERTRAAVVEAWIELVHAGDLRPTALRIAERAGVSVRSVYQHFRDLEALVEVATERQLARIEALMEPIAQDAPLEVRLSALVERRARIFEEISPLRRAAALQEPVWPEIAARLDWARELERDAVTQVFAAELGRLPGAERARLRAALVAAAAWTTWEGLRVDEGLALEDARAVVRQTLAALLGA